jgi:hypothetical protein
MCCGQAREQLKGTSSQAHEFKAAAGSASAAYFEYVGHTSLTVLCPVTGRCYHFNCPGDRVLVDLRDEPWLATIPHVREIYSA